MGLSAVDTTILGIVMALRLGNNKTAVQVRLAGGVKIPMVWLMFSHNISKSKNGQRKTPGHPLSSKARDRFHPR